MGGGKLKKSIVRNVKRIISLGTAMALTIGALSVTAMAESAGDLYIDETLAVGEQPELSYVENRKDYTSYAYNFNPVTLTGYGGTDMLNVALAQAGRKEGSADWYTSSEAWCAIFVLDCAKKSGQTSAIPQKAANAGVRSLYNSVIGAGGQVVTTPQAGDLVFYVGTSLYYHVGIMKSTTRSIEGNLSNKVYDNVNPKNYSSGSNSVANGGIKLVYVRPNYINDSFSLVYPEQRYTYLERQYYTNEEVSITWSYTDIYSHCFDLYWFDVWYDGVGIISEYCGTERTHSFTPTKPGEYTVVITVADKAGGYLQSLKTYNIIDYELVYPEITFENDSFIVGEMIVAVWAQSDTSSTLFSNYWLDVWFNDEKVVSENREWIPHGSFTPSEPGDYEVVVTVGDIFGNYKQAYTTITVVDEKNESINNFVERLYTKLLGRGSDAKGKANHVNSLKSGSTAAEIGAKFVLSTELKNKNLTNREFVKRMYQTFLDRTPSSNEITRWAKTLDNGCTYEYILGRFVASAEFKKLVTNYGITAGTYTPTQNRDQNENVTAFVSRMYTKALKRSYDVTGLNNHTGRIINKTHTPADIAKLFFFSTELKNKNLSDEEFVIRLYNALFDRNPDATGKVNWLTKMKNGYTREKVFDGFAASAEFKNLVASFGL